MSGLAAQAPLRDEGVASGSEPGGEVVRHVSRSTALERFTRPESTTEVVRFTAENGIRTNPYDLSPQARIARQFERAVPYGDDHVIVPFSRWVAGWLIAGIAAAYTFASRPLELGSLSGYVYLAAVWCIGILALAIGATRTRKFFSLVPEPYDDQGRVWAVQDAETGEMIPTPLMRRRKRGERYEELAVIVTCVVTMLTLCLTLALENSQGPINYLINVW